MTRPNPFGLPVCAGCGYPMGAKSRAAGRPEGARRHRRGGYCHNCVNRAERRWMNTPTSVRPKPSPSTAEPDPIAITRLLAGDVRLRVTNAELRIAVLALDAKGWSSNRIAAHLGINPRTVTRHRTARKAAEQVAA